MERDDLEGAIAAAEYFLLLYPYVYATGDLDEWEAMSHVECVFCASVSENVEDMSLRGVYVEDPGIQILESSGARPTDSTPYYGADVQIRVRESVEFDSAGEEIRRWASGEELMLLALDRMSDDWIIREVSPESNDSDE